MSLAMYAAPFDNINENNNDENNFIDNKKQSHNKTHKKYPKDDFDAEKVNSVLEKMQNIHRNSVIEDPEGHLADFLPPPAPMSTYDIKEPMTNLQSSSLSPSQSHLLSHSQSHLLSPSLSPSLSPPLSQTNTLPLNMKMSQILGKAPAPVYDSGNTYDLNNFNSNYGTNKTRDEYYKKYVPNYNPSMNKQSYDRHMEQNIGQPGESDALMQKLNYMIHLLEEQQDEKTGNVTEEVVLYSFLGIFIIFIVDSFARVGKYVR